MPQIKKTPDVKVRWNAASEEVYQVGLGDHPALCCPETRASRTGPGDDFGRGRPHAFPAGSVAVEDEAICRPVCSSCSARSMNRLTPMEATTFGIAGPSKSCGRQAPFCGTRTPAEKPAGSTSSLTDCLQPPQSSPIGKSRPFPTGSAVGDGDSTSSVHSRLLKPIHTQEPHTPRSQTDKCRPRSIQRRLVSDGVRAN